MFHNPRLLVHCLFHWPGWKSQNPNDGFFLHGISGAIGKVGAIIGSVGFLWASHGEEEKGYPEVIGMTTSLIILAIVCLLGMVVTFFFTRETMGRWLEQNESDD
jgi:PHS family inorganic phosphate transporter-like MFS transporter